MHGNTASLLLDPREYWSGLDRQSRVLAISVAVSILLHAVLLTIQFRFPDALRWKSASQPLEVILVNSKTRDKPSRAKALAQANLDGGGNTGEKRRASRSRAKSLKWLENFAVRGDFARQHCEPIAGSA